MTHRAEKALTALASALFILSLSALSVSAGDPAHAAARSLRHEEPCRGVHEERGVDSRLQAGRARLLQGHGRGMAQGA
jgi:hypothetical protein